MVFQYFLLFTIKRGSISNRLNSSHARNRFLQVKNHFPTVIHVIKAVISVSTDSSSTHQTDGLGRPFEFFRSAFDRTAEVIRRAIADLIREPHLPRRSHCRQEFEGEYRVPD